MRAVLSQAALHMHLPEGQLRTSTGPEYDRLRNTLKQLKLDAQGGLGPVGAQLAMETEASRVVDHVNAQVRAVQRAFGVLADTLEDEVGFLRSADTRQWEQLKVHAAHFGEIEELKAELERVRGELRATQSDVATFKADEIATLRHQLEEMRTEMSEQRERIDTLEKGFVSERHSLIEEVGSLRRWRQEVAAPFIDTASRSIASHEGQLDRQLPELRSACEQVTPRSFQERRARALLAPDSQHTSPRNPMPTRALLSAG